MSTETSAITWTRSIDGDASVAIGNVVIEVWCIRKVWRCLVYEHTNTIAQDYLRDIAPDDLPGAQAAALKLAEEILKPYADAYSVIAEERMR